ncbi:MAG: AMP-binding protein [Acidimicrobiia bacterium]|nr:AMP-binding protein [Acidimicrobiia bacterium]
MDRLHSLSLDDVMRELAASHPTRTAVVDGTTRLTYAELDRRVDRVAAALAADVQPGGRILWLGQNSFRILELLFACARLDAILVPANWRMSAAELTYVTDDTEPAVVVWQHEALAAHAEAVRENTGVTARWLRHDDPTAGPESYEGAVASAPDTAPYREADAANPVLGMYTAAFEGRPKAALLSHAGLLAQNMAVAIVQGVDHDYVYLNSGPLFHVATFMTTLATAHMGGTNVFCAKADPEELLTLIESERCTGAFLLPPTMDRMIELNKDGRFDIHSLRSIPYKPEWNEMVSVYDSAWTRKPGGYGQTELCGLATATALGGDSVGKSGRPSPLARIRIVNPDGEDVAPGETGEIVVRGPMVMAGYLGHTEATEHKRRGGWHHTGDLGRREADGSLTFIAPMAKLIKTGAENVYPAEVEATLSRHPAVAEVCVIGVPDPRWRQNVRAVVVLTDGTVGSDALAADLIDFCREHLASYKKPKDVVFAASLPRTSAGQTDRDAVDAAHGGGGYPGTHATL